MAEPSTGPPSTSTPFCPEIVLVTEPLLLNTAFWAAPPPFTPAPAPVTLTPLLTVTVTGLSCRPGVVSRLFVVVTVLLL